VISVDAFMMVPSLGIEDVGGWNGYDDTYASVVVAGTYMV
jgi:hypothetical protein